jgi:hypothetical protein
MVLRGLGMNGTAAGDVNLVRPSTVSDRSKEFVGRNFP